MINLKHLQFVAKIQVGTLLKCSNGLLMRVDEINDRGFKGQSIYKGKDMSETYLSFKALTNPHYFKNIEIIG